MAEVYLEGMALADGVMETILSIALENVEGVRLMGAGAQANPLAALSGRPGMQSIDVSSDEAGNLHVGVHVEADYGHALPELAATVRQSIYDAVLVQVGVEVASVDVFIDGIKF